MGLFQHRPTVPWVLLCLGPGLSRMSWAYICSGCHPSIRFRKPDCVFSYSVGFSHQQKHSVCFLGTFGTRFIRSCSWAGVDCHLSQTACGAMSLGVEALAAVWVMRWRGRL